MFRRNAALRAAESRRRKGAPVRRPKGEVKRVQDGIIQTDNAARRNADEVWYDVLGRKWSRNDDFNGPQEFNVFISRTAPDDAAESEPPQVGDELTLMSTKRDRTKQITVDDVCAVTSMRFLVTTLGE